MVGRTKKGVLALDIDGTITSHLESIDDACLDILVQAHTKGWEIIFLTGRTFSFAKPVLKKIPFAFHCVCQNGAISLSFPKEVIFRKKYLNKELAFSISSMLLEEKIPFIIESGFENQDIAYYLASVFATDVEYLKHRKEISKSHWQEVPSWEQLACSSFPAMKYFTTKSEVERIAQNIKNQFGSLVSVVSIKDPFRKMGSYLALINHYQATKGEALQNFLELCDIHTPLIVAGDDYNDVEMLEKADIKIVMNTAPLDMQKRADIVAASAKEQGLVAALKGIL